MIRYILALVCTTILAVGAAVVGLYLPSAPTLWTGLAIGCAVCVVGICIGNLIAESKRVNFFRKMTERHRSDYRLKVKAEIERDYRKAERRVWSTIAWGYVYLVGFVLLCLVGIACLVALGNTGVVIAFALPVMGLFMRLFARAEIYNLQSGLSRKEYPLLYALARKAQAEVGCKGKVAIDFGDSLGINETHGYIYIGISPIFYAICTDEELYAALLHEFAHVKNHDTRRSHRFFRQKAFWLHEESLGSSLFLSFLASCIQIKIDIYEWISARYYERAADQQVLQSGAEQAFINAAAKAEELSIYFNMYRRETLYDCFASEKPIPDAVSLELATYETYRAEWSKIWDQILSNRLSALVDSHPSLKERMEALGVKTYDASQREDKEDACNERKKMLAVADRLNARSLSKEYEELRQEEYLEPKAIMEEYCKAEAEGKTLPLARLKDCPKAFYGKDDERVKTIAQELIANDYYAAVGHDALGKLWYHRMDGRCMQELKAAMESKPDLYEDCLEYMGSFVLRTGDEEQIRRFREESVELAQRAIDCLKAARWSMKSPSLRKSSLSNELVEGLCRYVKAQGDRIRSMYIADYGKEITVTAIILETSAPVQSALWHEIFDDVIDYFNAFPVLATYVDFTGKGVARALYRAKIQPVYRQERT